MLRSAELLDRETLRSYPLDPSRPFLAGRDPSLDLPLRDPGCSRLHFRVERSGDGFQVVTMSATAPTLVDGRPIDDRASLRPGATIAAGAYRLIYRERIEEAGPEAPDPAPAPPPGPSDDLTAMYVAGPDDESQDFAPIDLPDGRGLTIGRDPARADILLPHPRVSRRHARVERNGDRAVMIDTSSANGTFVDGRRLSGGATLRPGARVDIGPFALAFDGRRLVPESRSGNLELVARGLTRIVRGPHGPVTLLDDVTLAIRPREFVALLGPSGAGKSTLLDVLGGRSAVESGRVLLNGRDLHAHFDALKQDVALVPQHATLHDGLTLDQALHATARLRLPRDTSRAEIAGRVDSILRAVGLVERRALRIGRLSGGQRRRAALANEVLSQPGLLFLDEVTSGLDEQADREMMRLFRAFADAGKTVVCVTHSLANVEQTCHRVAFLAPGGKLAFFGPPAEALSYFEVERLGDVYEKLADPSTSPAEWKARFEESEDHGRHVAARLAGRCEASVPVQPVGAVPARERCRAFSSQFRVLLLRSALVQIADRRATLMALGQAVSVALILYALFGDISAMSDPVARVATTRKLLFLLAISSVWFGCNNAAREIVRERTIYDRERDVNLQVGSYYASKLALLGATSSLQVALLLGMVLGLCGPPVGSGSVAALLGILGLAGVGLGLLISAWSRTEAVAVSLVPIALIPQIVLAGVIAPLSGAALAMARLGVTTYWGYHGLTHALTGVPEPLASGEGPAPATALVVVLAHLALLGGMTLAALRLGDGRTKPRDLVATLLREVRERRPAVALRRRMSALAIRFRSLTPPGARR